MAPEEMVQWMMQRLMRSTAESFDLALSRFDASEQEEALEHARRLLASEDPAERELGERLKAAVARTGTPGVEVSVRTPEGQGGNTHPLSLMSSGSSAATATSSDDLPSTGQDSSQKIPVPTSSSEPTKRPRGRPRKHPRPDPG
jgi:hypothetical protein